MESELVFEYLEVYSRANELFMCSLDDLMCMDYYRVLLWKNDLYILGYSSRWLKQGLECLELCSQASKLLMCTLEYLMCMDYYRGLLC